MSEQNYKDSPEWQKAVELAKEVSDLTKKLAKAEGMLARATPQHICNRYAESIAMDIAEAAGRAAMPGGSLRYLSIAQGTTFRLETQLLLDVEKNFVTKSDVEAALKLCGELGALLAERLNALAAAREERRRPRPFEESWVE